MIYKPFFLPIAILLTLNQAHAMEHVSLLHNLTDQSNSFDSDSDSDDENQSIIIIDTTNHDSTNNSSKKESFITPLLIVFLNHHLTRDILVEKIIPFLVSSKKFMFFTNLGEYKHYKQDRKIEALAQKFEAIDLSDNKGDEEDAEPKALELSDREIILRANVEQLNDLTYSQKQRCLQNILKCMHTGLFDQSHSQAILISLLSACNQDFSLLSQEDKEAYSLPDLIELFKTTFDSKSIAERTLIVVAGTPNKISQGVFCGMSVVAIASTAFIECMAASLINTGGTGAGIFIAGVGLVVPILIFGILRYVMNAPTTQSDWKDFHYHFDEAEQELG